MAIDKPKDISDIDSLDVKEEIFTDDAPVANVPVADESALIAAGVPANHVPVYSHVDGSFK